MNLDEFLIKYEGKTVGYPDGSYVGECLSIVKKYILEVFNLNPPPSGSGSAYGYWSNFPSPLGTVFNKVENTIDGVPNRGDIMIWKPWSTNQYGHISIFLDGNEFWFNSMDQNWGGRHFHKVTHDYTNVVGWLTPKGDNMGDDFGDMVYKSEQHDKTVKYIWGDKDPRQTSSEDIQSHIAGLKSRCTDLSKQLAIANAEVLNREEQVGRLKDQLLEKDRIIDDLSIKLKEYDKIVENMQGSLDAVYRDKGELLKTIAELKSADPLAGFTRWELIKYALFKK